MNDEACPFCDLAPADRSSDHIRGGVVYKEVCIADLRNKVVRLQQQQEDAHGQLDMLEPCPPRIDHSSALTVCGRIVRWREMVGDAAMAEERAFLRAQREVPDSLPAEDKYAETGYDFDATKIMVRDLIEYLKLLPEDLECINDWNDKPLMVSVDSEPSERPYLWFGWQGPG